MKRGERAGEMVRIAGVGGIWRSRRGTSKGKKIHAVRGVLTEPPRLFKENTILSGGVCGACKGGNVKTVRPGKYDVLFQGKTRETWGGVQF